MDWVLRISGALMMACLLSGNGGLGSLRKACGGKSYKLGMIVGGIWVFLQGLPRCLCGGRI